MQRAHVGSSLFVILAFAGVLLVQGCAAPAASLVMGQPDFVSNRENQGKGQAADNTLLHPAGPVVAYHDSMYVSDSGNDRILVFSPFPAQNDPAAVKSIHSVDPGKWLNFSGPYAVSIANGRMFVADTGNNRVLIWNKIPSSSETPDIVLGQPDLTGPSVADCAHMNDLRSLFATGEKLIVSDCLNNRILIWNSIPARTDPKHPVAADMVLGDPRCAPDTAGATRHTFNNPRGVWTDGTRLVVADTENNRVLIWNRFPTKPSDDADIVLGTGKAGSGKNQFRGPYAVASDGTRLFVSDWNNNRVLVWDRFPTKDGELPSAVFGQRNFKRWGPNGQSHDEGKPGTPTASGLQYPQGVFYQDGRMWVTDTDNNRILMFELEKQKKDKK